jgi:DNA polymerase I
MKIFNTADLNETSMKTMNADEASWVYNGLDVGVTAEVYNVLIEQLAEEPPNVQRTYAGSLAKLAPIMEMTMRGTLIDEGSRQRSIIELSEMRRLLDAKFQRIMVACFGGELNWNSPLQLKNLFYGMLGVKEVKKRNTKGQYTATVNREALEQFQIYLHARPLAKMILVLRDLHKQITFLKTELDDDHRMRTSYNIAGTNTGRLSSSMSDFGTGTNLQNVNRQLRFPFVADPGMYLLNIDLEQSDGRNIGAVCWNLFYDATAEDIAKALGVDEWTGPVGAEFAGTYLNAAEGEDLHTTVCNMVWPDLEWPEDVSEWKKFCDGIIAHGQDSYRQLSKKGGHGTNYYGTPPTMAKHLHTTIKIMEYFQKGYFAKFPCIKAFHGETIRQVRETGVITSIFGRRRHFFGRGNDASTHRKAIAFCGQSPTGEQIDRGLLQVWRAFPQVQLLNQVHDSILLQLPFSEVEDLAPRIMEEMKVTLQLKGGRDFTVPLDAAGGWNWGYADKQNPHGLKGWKGSETRDKPSPRKRLKDYL